MELLAEVLDFLNCHIHLMDWGEKFLPLLVYNSVVNILKKKKKGNKLAHCVFAMLGLVQLHKNLCIKYTVVGK